MARPAPKKQQQDSALSESTQAKLAHTGTLRPSQLAAEYDNTEWVVLQREVFNGWVKYQMSKRNLQFEDLRTDFQTGVVLCQLLEVLSGQTIKHNANPKLNMHYIENVNAAFSFMAKEKVKFKGWQPNDLVTGQNPKCPLALVWGLLQKYQFREDDGQEAGAPDELLVWVNERLQPYGMHVDSFRAPAWQDGVILSALVHSITPEDIDAPNKLDKANGLANTVQAMNVAEEELKIPKLFDPKALSDGKLDDKSIKTYVSFFPIAAKEAGVGRGLTPRGKRSGKKIEVDSINPRIRDLRRKMQAVNNPKKAGPPKRKAADLPKDIPYGKKELDKCEKELDNLIKERETMKKEIETLTQKLKEANTEKENLQKQLMSATGAHKIASELDEKVKRLEKELAEAKAKNEKLEKEVADLRKENEELKKALREKTARVSELETENLHLKEKVKDLEKKVEDEKKKMSELESKISSSSGAADALREQQKREKAEMEARIKKLEEDLAAARKENAELRNRIKELEAERDVQKKAKETEIEEKLKAQQRCRAVEEDLTKKEAEARTAKQALEEEKSKQEREKQRIREESEEKLRQMARDNQRLREDLQAAQSQLNNKARSVGATQDELEKAKDQELALKQDKRRAEDMLEAEKRDRRRDLADAESKLAARDRELQALKDEINRLKKNEEDALAQMKRLQEELAKARADALAARGAGLPDEEAQRRIADLERQLEALRQENKRLAKYKKLYKELLASLQKPKGKRVHPGEIKMPGRPPLYNTHAQ